VAARHAFARGNACDGSTGRNLIDRDDTLSSGDSRIVFGVFMPGPREMWPIAENLRSNIQRAGVANNHTLEMSVAQVVRDFALLPSRPWPARPASQ
jgi:hypothetical protein